MWREYQSTNKALKHILLSTVGYMYTRVKKHRVKGYANITGSQQTIHLYAKYGNITEGALKENK